MGEQVLVVPRDVLFSDGLEPFAGFRPGRPSWAERIAAEARFVARGPAETDPRQKQLIPYAVVCAPGGEGEEMVFLLRRTRGGSEHRLHESLSIGVGGHVNPVDARADASPWAAVEAALERELAEELSLGAPIVSRRLVGFVNDDDNEVGQVHFGVVFRVALERPVAQVRERDRLAGEFVGLGELGRRREGLETWSRFVAEALFGGRLDPASPSDVSTAQNL